MTLEKKSNGSSFLLVFTCILVMSSIIVNIILLNHINNEVNIIKNNEVAIWEGIQEKIDNASSHQLQQSQLDTLQANLIKQMQGDSVKVDKLNNTITELNNKIAELQKQEVANQTAINNLQNAINAMQASYPYYPRSHYNYYDYPVAIIQSSSNELTLRSTSYDNGLRVVTTYYLEGFVKIVLNNPNQYDIDDAQVIISFDLSGSPDLSSANIQLTGGDTEWSLVTKNSNEIRFQSSGYGLTVGAGQTIILPLVLTVYTHDNVWQQSYPFDVDVWVD